MPISQRRGYAIVHERSGRVCERCGRARATSVHHRQKRSQQGDHRPANLVHLCGDGTTGCHGWVEHCPEQARETGYQVDSHQDPSDVPIRTRHGLVLLDDEGGMSAVARPVSLPADLTESLALLDFPEV
jgi:hypothetical protein